MEVDAINQSLASRSTQALDQHRLGLSNRGTRVVDISQEHTNGRMFEQAVQNANKAGETSASTSDNIKLSNSKVDQNADAKNENPLTLNQKEARQQKDYTQSDMPEDEEGGEDVLKQAFKTININYINLSEMSKDTILVKGQAIDKFVMTKEVSSELEKKADDDEIKIGQTSNISEVQIKRLKVQKIAEETYHDVAHLELEVGNEFQTSVVQGLIEIEFGKEVTSIMFDQPRTFREL